MSTGTMKYKATGRYDFGWSDPRTMAFISRFEELKTVVMGHYSREMTNDALRAAWILEYGDRPITFYELKSKWGTAETGNDMMCTAQETHYRKLLLDQYDIANDQTVYVLKDKLEET